MDSTKYDTIEKGEGKVPNIKKLIEKMKQQPNGIRPEEVEKVLGTYGYVPVRQNGVKVWKLKII